VEVQLSIVASPALVGRFPPPTVSGFSCHIAPDQGAARVRVEGELDIANEARFAAVLDRCQATSALVIVDLRGLEFLSCGGASC
jgi:anti-anti-sigma factor